MSKRVVISILAVMALVIGALVCILYLQHVRDGVVTHEALTDAIGALDADATYMDEKAMEIFEAIGENTKEPGGLVRYGNYEAAGQKIVHVADTYLARIDSLRARLDDKKNISSNKVDRDIQLALPWAWLDEAYRQMMVVQGVEDSAWQDRELREEKYPCDLGHSRDVDRITKGMTRNAFRLHLARLRAVMAGMKHYHLAKLYDDAHLDCHMDFKPLRAMAICRSGAAMVGDRIETGIFAVNADWVESMGGRVTSVTADGKKSPFHGPVHTHKYYAGGPGLSVHHGMIEVEGIRYAGHMELRWEQLVLTPTAVVSAEAEQVLRVGKERLVKISAQGYNAKDIAVSLSRGSVTRSGDRFILKVDDPGPVILRVKARSWESIWRVVGEFTYDVK